MKTSGLVALANVRTWLPARHPALLLLVAGLFASACGLVNVKGLPGSPGPGANNGAVAAAPASAASGSAAAAPGARGTDRAPDPAVVKLYRALDYTCCVGRYHGSGRELFQKAGISDIGLGQHGSPDPEWILDWSSRHSSTDMVGAVVQAAANRTWQKQCLADAALFFAGWAKIDRRYRGTLEALVKPGNYYEKTAGLLALMAKVEQEAEAAGLNLSREHPTRWAGIRYQIAKALVELHHNAKKDYVLHQMLAPVQEDIAAFAVMGRTLSTDAALERDAFCGYGERFGTHKTPALPDLRVEAIPLKWPVSNAGKQAVNAMLAKAKPEAKAALAIQPSWIIPSIDDPSLAPSNAPDRRLVWGGPYTVKSVKRRGARTTVLAQHNKSELDVDLRYDCRAPARVMTTDLAGNPVRANPVCKYGSREMHTEVTLTFDDLPASVDVRAGDQIRFYGDIVRDGQKMVQRTKSHIVERRQVALENPHLREVQRNKAVVHRF